MVSTGETDCEVRTQYFLSQELMAGQERKAGLETVVCCPQFQEICPPPYWRDPPAPLERRVRPASWANQAFRANLANLGRMESMGRLD